MTFRLGRLILGWLRATAFNAIGAVAVLLIVFVVYLNNRADLDVWHLAELDEEFTADSGIETLEAYLKLETRLFAQLDGRVYAKIPPAKRSEINRYSKGSLSDPGRWSRNWNQSFELSTDSQRAAVLLLHGMSDSPYSLRHLGKRLNDAGAHVLGLRMPGHGTAPSGLVNVGWEDMAAAVQLGMHHLSRRVGAQPIYIVGYSTGGALAVHYVLQTLVDETLPKAEGLILLSPAIGVTPAAALAVWQARLGDLLGFDKLAWHDIIPEYDPFKYSSFAVNAGDVVYRLTSEIQASLDAMGEAGRLNDFPPILAFSSVVDATVSAPVMVGSLFLRLPAGGHELVLFDINHWVDIEPILKSDPSAEVQALQEALDRSFVLSLVTNENENSRRTVVRRFPPGDHSSTEQALDLSWPEDLYSLAHISLPFPPDDPLYGGRPNGENPGLRLGDVALRGERDVLEISASNILRLRWNPFYPYVESRVLDFLEPGQ